MKDRRLQTKRQTKKGFRTLFAKTAQRKQRASTATPSDMDELEGDIPKVGIGRALTVILILHIVAIAAIYMGTKWKGADSEGSNAVATYTGDDDESSARAHRGNQHKFRVGEPSSYQEYQRSPEVGHQMPNDNMTRVSQARVQPAAEPRPTRQPTLIRPKRNPNAHVNLPATPRVKFKSHTIVAGDTIYRIAMRNNVKPQEILDINNIADTRKVRIGMVIKIPVK